MSLISSQRLPKQYKLLTCFMISAILLKMGKHNDFYLSFFQIVGPCQNFTFVSKLRKDKSLYDLGGSCLKIRDVCMDFEPCLKVDIFVSAHPKSIKLGQIAKLDVRFHVVRNFAQLRNGQLSNKSLEVFG